MAEPTKATRTAAHVAVGVGAAYVVPRLIGKNGVMVALVGAMVVVLVHAMLDAPLAKMMAANGLQFG